MGTGGEEEEEKEELGRKRGERRREENDDDDEEEYEAAHAIHKPLSISAQIPLSLLFSLLTAVIELHTTTTTTPLFPGRPKKLRTREIFLSVFPNISLPRAEK